MSETIVSREAVMTALRGVKDPELDRSIMDLNMVRDVVIEGSHVHVVIALTVKGCPLRVKIKDDIKQKISEVSGVESVKVEMTVMTDEERMQMIYRNAGEKEAKSNILNRDSKTKIIAVSSGKGGVGKSTVSVNLAVGLSMKGYQVGVMDADIYGFSVPKMLGMEGRPTVFNKAIVPLKAYDMQVMSMGFLVEEDTPVVWRGTMLTGAINQFLRDVLWADLDYLVIDLPPGTGDIALSIINRLPNSKILLVTTPQETATSVAIRAGHLALNAEQEILGVVENMSYFLCPTCGDKSHIFGTGGAEKIATELNTRVLGRIPIEPAVGTGGDTGKPVVYHNEESASAAAFRELVDTIVSQA